MTQRKRALFVYSGGILPQTKNAHQVLSFGCAYIIYQKAYFVKYFVTNAKNV